MASTFTTLYPGCQSHSVGIAGIFVLERSAIRLVSCSLLFRTVGQSLFTENVNDYIVELTYYVILQQVRSSGLRHFPSCVDTKPDESGLLISFRHRVMANSSSSFPFLYTEVWPFQGGISESGLILFWREPHCLTAHRRVPIPKCVMLPDKDAAQLPA